MIEPSAKSTGPTKPYVCIHGHFYQPPRENPWLEAIELQDSAHPYHDWNERITAECYAPNAASRIFDGDGGITAIVNNYSRISFNFGPTLLAWLQEKAPHVHDALVEADRDSQQRFSGHGSALAQPYNHMIMPLANARDKRTQVLWGIHDFVGRFGRPPEGMWLPETAVDLETLDLLAEQGICFTVLAPHQARRARRLRRTEWEDVSGGRIDPSMPYLLRLPSGRSINLFFYDGPVSRGVAFEGLLSNGERFAERLIGSYTEGQNRGRLVHIATDGETYGHHHRFGDMALAYALHHIEANERAQITNYGEYLELYPPTSEVEIYEDTSWSCVHGVERWRSDCGCSTGGPSGWNQAWRAPVREALDWLRDNLVPLYETRGLALFKNPWTARDEYIRVVRDRSPENVDAFLRQQAARELDDGDKTTALKLLELQRNAMLMFTSCGWFFTELSGIETVQCLQYAGRAIQLAEEVFNEDLEHGFLDILERAKSNLPDHRDGARVYAKFVRPAVVDLQKVAAHYAISSMFEPYGEEARVYCYDVVQEDYRSVQSGRSKVAVGRARVTSQITRECATLSFGVLHFGDHNVLGGDRLFLGNEAYQAMARDLIEAFTVSDLPQAIRALDKHLGTATYSLRSLFRDEQHRILDSILESVVEDTEAINRQLYERYAPLMRFLTDLGYPKPSGLDAAAELVLNADLERVLERGKLDRERVQGLLDDASRLGVTLDSTTPRFALRARLASLAEALRADPRDLQALLRLARAVDLARSLPFQVDLWQTQNVYWSLLHSVYPEVHQRAAEGSQSDVDWISSFHALGDALGMRVPR